MKYLFIKKEKEKKYILVFLGFWPGCPKKKREKEVTDKSTHVELDSH